MRFGILSLLLFLCFACNAQEEGLAIINDPDGYVNVQHYSGTNYRIDTHHFDNWVFMFVHDPDTASWAEFLFEPELSSLDIIERAYYQNFISDGECRVDGVISLNKFIRLCDLPHINANVVKDTTTKQDVIAQNDTIKFIATKSKKDSLVEGIHGKKIYGNLETLPNWQLTSIKLALNGKEIEIPDSSYNDLLEPQLETFMVSYDKKGSIYLYMLGSDGCCSYYAAWIIKNGRYLKRYVETSTYN